MTASQDITTHPTIISIGYERRNIDEFVDLLKKHGVTKLVDIRERPLSRKKGFSKKSVSTHLEAKHIQYVHLRDAGNPYHKEKHDLERCLSLYRTYLNEHPEIAALVISEIDQPVTAMLCYERLHVDCHRSVLLEAMKQHGLVATVHEVD